MRLPFPRPASALILALGPVGLFAASAPPQYQVDPASQRFLQNLRSAQAQAHLASLRSQLGLGERDAFVPRQVFTNRQGETVVHFVQTFEGYRVWGGQAVAHVHSDGRVETQTRSVRGGIQLQGEPRLSGEEARKIALGYMAPRGPMKDAPRLERVVFPSQFLDGLPSRLDAHGRPVLDRSRVVHAKLAEPYVWAYEVWTRLHNPEDGSKELTYLIDASTGAVLRIHDRVQHLDPVQGTGKGFYRGEVRLNTTQMADGTFALMDTTRGSRPGPWLQSFSPDPASGWDPTIPALQVWFAQSDAQRNYGWADFLFQNGVNAWGDGLAFTDWGNSGGTNGQSAGVDAMHAMTTTWDFYRNVFGREGMDGQGTAVTATVLQTRSYYLDNAEWSTWGQSMELGAGSFPDNAKGFQSMTDLDVIAHEMTHGVTSPSQSQYWVNSAGFEEAGLNEAVSDFFAQMVKAYSTRPAGEDTAIPAVGADWQIGRNVGHGTPIRSLDKPSRDQRSQNGWFDGIRYMDGHFSAGPLNRAFYFLCNGSSSNPADPSFSPYLPGGMAGIGNDPAARIVYKAVTEFLVGDGTGSISFMDVREACLKAATHLQAGYSHWIPAVRNAFAAANLGDAHGQLVPRTQVRFDRWRNDDYIESTKMTEYGNREVFPKGEQVVPRITVLNNPNKAVTWSLGGPSMFNGADSFVNRGGVLNADGSWTTPNVVGWHSITATSKADPNQFAEGRVFLINMDSDMDLEQDALDLAGIAFSWYLTNSLNPAHSVFEAPWVDDADVAFFVDAMRATWSVK